MNVYVVIHETKHETDLSVFARRRDATDAVGRRILFSIHPDEGGVVISKSQRKRLREAVVASDFGALTAAWQDISDECFRIEECKLEG